MSENQTKLVLKAAGYTEEFRPDKIFNSIWMAANNVGGNDKTIALNLKEEVVSTLIKRYPNGE